MQPSWIDQLIAYLKSLFQRRRIGATRAQMFIAPVLSKKGVPLMAKIANWANGEFYRAKVKLTKDDGSQGRAQSAGGKSGSFASADATVSLTQLSDDADGNPLVEIRGTANAAATVTWDGDGDLGSGVLLLHTEGVAVFSDADVEATGAAMDFGEPVTA